MTTGVVLSREKSYCFLQKEGLGGGEGGAAHHIIIIICRDANTRQVSGFSLGTFSFFITFSFCFGHQIVFCKFLYHVLNLF